MTGRGGGKLKIKAYVGASKTSTLRLVANRLAHQRGIYLAFNREIAEQARRGFSSNVLAETVHSLADRSVSPQLAARVKYPAEPPHELAARYGLGPVQVPLVTGNIAEVTPFELGQLGSILRGHQHSCAYVRALDMLTLPLRRLELVVYFQGLALSMIP